jgi:hypothetical protein
VAEFKSGYSQPQDFHRDGGKSRGLGKGEIGCKQKLNNKFSCEEITVKNLYFIPKIFNAIKSRNPHHELEKAFKEILSLGCQKQYRQGFEQFVRFMGAVYDYILNDDEYLDSIRSAYLPPDPGIEIVLERNGACLATITYRHRRIIKTITNVKPGNFILKFTIGRVIWSGEITKIDLFWEEAFPREDLRLAAETEKPATKVSRIIRLFNGEVIIRVIPGIEHGNVDILFKGENIG